ncbi:MAG TPA: glycerol-3-phosphate dehydrogenase C-terminal domain-containing protein, partial [bacterium]|nr:glycerol-3-phosphate dehydrogenase C-terminal domain-containing protein [bacterium]
AFVVPWQGAALIGTTDTEWAGPAEPHPAAAASDVSYLLDHAGRFLTVRLGAADVLSAFAGLRPLLTASRAASTARLSRRHAIFDGPPGFITITGGKLTTYRRMAEDVMNHALGLPSGTPSPTRDLPLDGADGLMRAVPMLRARARSGGVNARTLRHLLRAYGTRAARVLDLIADTPALGALLAAGHPHLAAEVVLAVREESAVTVEDVLLRRMRLGHLLPDQGRGAAAAVASLMAAALGWSAADEAEQAAAYRQSAAALAPALPGRPAARQESPAPP